MKHKIHTPTFLAASFCLILGLWLQTQQLLADELVFSIILLMSGFGLFFFTYRDNNPLHKNDKLEFIIPYKISIIVTFIGIVFWFFIDGMYIKLFNFINGLLSTNLLK